MDLRRDSRIQLRSDDSESAIRSAESTNEEHQTRGQRARSRETSSPTSPVPSRGRSMRQELRRMLASRHSIRQAIVLNEIIGPPKALQQKQ